MCHPATTTYIDFNCYLLSFMIDSFSTLAKKHGLMTMSECVEKKGTVMYF